MPDCSDTGRTRSRNGNRDALVGTVPSTTGVPGLAPLPWVQTLAVFSYAMVCCLIVNDVLKVALMQRVGLRT
jgi:hypothetical protein